ncbi:hypothetical protein H5410_054319 [Solanum commersonii]|uniref:Uncharacterized protein n=1 Tax=Solanum commersonii TaxID=4109 RepID=A0A9J5WEL9_SOLCO|nr:hypothetical protein H5410_054319 [Solanum commersonii]
MSLIYDRENAEVYTDPLICMKKSLELLEEINLPHGILPLEDVVEVGRNHETGSFVENRRLKNVTGVKTNGIKKSFPVSALELEEEEEKKEEVNKEDDEKEKNISV